MASFSGPTVSLPGHTSTTNQFCDNHSDVLAVQRIQGETDSFGAEYSDFCQECVDEFNNECSDASLCDWCSSESNDCSAIRDLDEGSMGRVYNVCSTCQFTASRR